MNFYLKRSFEGRVYVSQIAPDINKGEELIRKIDADVYLCALEIMRATTNETKKAH